MSMAFSMSETIFSGASGDVVLGDNKPWILPLILGVALIIAVYLWKRKTK